MPFIINRQQSLKVIDKTVLEICKSKEPFEGLEIMHFCLMLSEAGVDSIEIDAKVLEIIGALPSGADFLYRIHSVNDLELMRVNSISHCVICEELLSDEVLIKRLNKLNASVTLEIKADSLNNRFDFGGVRQKYRLTRFNSIRITGLNDFSELNYLGELINSGHREGIEVDICPDNYYYFAAAIAVEAVLKGTDYITASFMGYGGLHGFAALEELFIALKVLICPGCRMNLKKLPELCRKMRKLSGVSIPDNKAVLGENIFKYESGIHADGIEKSPIVYEPYNPEVIGQKRSLSIGKHSGKKSVTNKLKTLGIKFDFDELSEILYKIREKSIELKSELSDEEIRKICGVLI